MLVKLKMKTWMRSTKMLALLELLVASNTYAYTFFAAGGNTFSTPANHIAWRFEGEMYMLDEPLWNSRKWEINLKHTAGFFSLWDHNFVSGVSWVPSLVLQSTTPFAIEPYFQIGVGPAVMTSDKFESDSGSTVVDMGSRVHFESSFAIGFSVHDKVFFRTKVYHYSNAGYKEPNSGINTIEFGIGMWLD